MDKPCWRPVDDVRSFTIYLRLSCNRTSNRLVTVPSLRATVSRRESLFRSRLCDAVWPGTSKTPAWHTYSRIAFVSSSSLNRSLVHDGSHGQQLQRRWLKSFWRWV
jgi:hypothetical protein